MEDGANHLGGDPDTPDIDPDREFWPAGQGVGAIDELVPAGELVDRFVRGSRGRPRASVSRRLRLIDGRQIRDAGERRPAGRSPSSTTR